MRTLVLFSLLFPVFTASAQERLIDSLFQVSEVQTEVYATKEGEDLILDIYQPEGDDNSSRPAIIFMHGGGFSGGSPKNRDEIRFAELAASKGYVAIQISYRLTRKGQSFSCDYEASGKMETFKLAAEDFMDAVQYVVENSDRLKLDPGKIIVGGSSAGAEAVLNAVYNPQLMFEDPSAYDFNIAGVLSLAGAIVDARYITEEKAVPGAFFHGTGDNLVPYATAPHHFCDPGQPGYLMLDGSKTIVEKLGELDLSYLLMTYKGAGHEISGIPFNELDLVFRFFKDVILEGQKRQTSVMK